MLPPALPRCITAANLGCWRRLWIVRTETLKKPAISSSEHCTPLRLSTAVRSIGAVLRPAPGKCPNNHGLRISSVRDVNRRNAFCPGQGGCYGNFRAEVRAGIYVRADGKESHRVMGLRLLRTRHFANHRASIMEVRREPLLHGLESNQSAPGHSVTTPRRCPEAHGVG